MTLPVDDDGADFGPDVGPDHMRPEPKPVTAAEFEAGLSVVVEAFPMACLVLDRSARLVASNRAAEALVEGLRAPDMHSKLAAAMTTACHTCSPIPLDMPHGTGRFHVTSLTGPNGMDVDLCLIIQDHDAPMVGDGSAERPLSSYDLGPTPMRILQAEATRFKRLSETDPLTGALNVRAFGAGVAAGLNDASHCKGAMICLDLNRFKKINDTFGHVAGDKVLIHVASKLTFPDHTGILTARLGGDEFALWMPGVGPKSLPPVILGLRERLRARLDVSEENDRVADVSVTAAIGAACCPDEALDYAGLRVLADQRLYEDKARFGLARKHKRRAKRKGAVDPAPQSFLPR